VETLRYVGYVSLLGTTNAGRGLVSSTSKGIITLFYLSLSSQYTHLLKGGNYHLYIILFSNNKQRENRPPGMGDCYGEEGKARICMTACCRSKVKAVEGHKSSRKTKGKYHASQRLLEHCLILLRRPPRVSRRA